MAASVEEENKVREAAANLIKAMAILEGVTDPPESAVAGRQAVLRMMRIEIMDVLMRERNGETEGVECHCGYIKSHGRSCDTCQQYRYALYGGDNWVLYGV